MSDSKSAVDNGPDLDQMRDERVFPVAREVLADIADSLIAERPAENKDITPLVERTLEKSLAADFNIATDCSYLFQVLLGVFSGLNVTAQGALLAPIDSERYAGIARKVLRIVADANVRLGSVTPEQTAEDFAPVQAQLNALFTEENLNLVELKFIMDNIFESFNVFNNTYSSQIEQSVARAEAKLFGVETMNDLGIKRLDEVLKTPMVSTDALEGPGADEPAVG